MRSLISATSRSRATARSFSLRIPTTSSSSRRTPRCADVRWAGSTALHGAAIMDQPSIIQFLVEKGARLDAKNRLGWTPLMVTQGMLIAANGRWKPRAEALIRQLMIERGLDPALYSQRRAPTATAAQ